MVDFREWEIKKKLENQGRIHILVPIPRQVDTESD